MILVQSGNRPVIYYLSRVITPATVGHTTGSQLGDVTDHHAGQKDGGIRAVDLILEQRGYIQETSRLPKGRIFDVQAFFVATDGQIPGPVFPQVTSA